MSTVVLMRRALNEIARGSRFAVLIIFVLAPLVVINSGQNPGTDFLHERITKWETTITGCATGLSRQ
jgi:hypothetical protein